MNESGPHRNWECSQVRAAEPTSLVPIREPTRENHSINTTIQALTYKIKGKSPKPLVATFMAVDRKQKTIITYHKINGYTKLLKYLPQLSPHTRVCGMRRGFNKTNNTSSIKTRLTLKTQKLAYQGESNKDIPTPTKITLKHPVTTMHKNKDKTIIKSLNTTHKHILPTIILNLYTLRSKNKACAKPLINTHTLSKSLNPHTYETKNKHIKHERNKTKSNRLYKTMLPHTHNTNINNKTINQHNNTIPQSKNINTIFLPPQHPQTHKYEIRKIHHKTIAKYKPKQNYTITNQLSNTKSNMAKTKLLATLSNTHTHTRESKTTHSISSSKERSLCRKRKFPTKTYSTQNIKTIILKIHNKNTKGPITKNQDQGLNTKIIKDLSKHPNIHIKKLTSHTNKHLNQYSKTFTQTKSSQYFSITNPQPQLSPSPTHKYEIYFKHKEHIEHTNQRKINQSHKKPLPQHKSINTSEHLPLISPYTRVYGKRVVYDSTNNTLNMKPIPIQKQNISLQTLAKQINTFKTTCTKTLTLITNQRFTKLRPHTHMYIHNKHSHSYPHVAKYSQNPNKNNKNNNNKIQTRKHRNYKPIPLKYIKHNHTNINNGAHFKKSTSKRLTIRTHTHKTSMTSTYKHTSTYSNKTPYPLNYTPIILSKDIVDTIQRKLNQRYISTKYQPQLFSSPNHSIMYISNSRITKNILTKRK